MKKILLSTLLLIIGLTTYAAVWQSQGQITVTYNGAGKFPGHFKKSITIRTNGKNEMTRLYIEGDMTPKGTAAE